MKREYRKYIAWAAIIAVLYGLMKTMSDFFGSSLDCVGKMSA
jgi:hypothetical protein